MYAVTALLACAAVGWAMQLWNAEWRVPLFYHSGGDASFSSMLVKGIIDHGWYLHNSSVGAPDGLQMEDYPLSDVVHFLIIRILAIFSSNFGLVINFDYLLTFPLSAVSAAYVFRRFGASWGASLGPAILYTMLPYHFMRGEMHLLLSAYYLVPLIIMVAVWICTSRPMFEIVGSWRIRPTRYGWSSLIIAALMAGSSIYYTFFGTFLIGIATLIRIVRRPCTRVLIAPVIVLAVTFCCVTIYLSPTLLYQARHGRNAETAVRSVRDAEIYALRITQLVLPVTGHRLAFFSRVKRVYNGAIVNTESDFSTLGAVAAAGFLLLCAGLFFQPAGPAWKIFNDLCILNVACLLLATTSGFGSLVALLITAKIRGYTRISVFIAFFSLWVVALAADALRRLYQRRTLLVFAWHAAMAVILVGGILDQTTPAFAPSYAANESDYRNDEMFVRRIESALPANSMVFQLPYAAFPENGPVNRMIDYDLFRGYLHSHHLRWSYGTMRGREGQILQQHVSSLPVSQMIEAVALIGFSGIYIDRYGYPDNAKALERELTGVLHQDPVTSRNSRLAFFELSDYAGELRRSMDSDQRPRE